ncbi:hypothetical protein [Natrinema sp. 1APR25-10V2]|uniref:hypothetical protein n=1 Tax=Natrinema sp. 1APR25-10V2 TaxID=2951081 RepID=UPI002875006A|nr:hypothetical protein [Natrinema sp. 1APR25-10V2]MDS0478675.1 hypothetical protein [Natrinema sp. 1APR25-10V2]
MPEEQDDGTGYEEVVVRRVGDLGYTNDSEPPGIRGLGDHGWGTDLKTPAWDEVRKKIDPGDYEPKTHVATIHYDLDAWEYTIEYLVEVDRDA